MDGKLLTVEVGYCVEMVLEGRIFIVEVLVGGLDISSIYDMVELLL